jgi:tRNA1(Val) A37 N6-methylase TrmN6
MNLNNDEKQIIANKIKCISEIDIKNDYEKLKKMATEANAVEFNERCRVGNNVVDFFTFRERLETRGKYNINFYDFIANIEEFKKKKFIQTMLTYYETTKNARGLKNEYIVLKEVYNICISAINIFRPLVAVEVYQRFKPTRILDFSAGWGGRAVGAAVCSTAYIGLDINAGLRDAYNNMSAFLNSSASSASLINMVIADAVSFDYSTISPGYDMVFTSPPYYFIEKYSHNESYASKDEMDQQFYIPVFSNTFKNLLPGGHFVLNINKEIYERVCLALFGPAEQIMNCKKSSRQNKYREMIYIWKKNVEK